MSFIILFLLVFINVVEVVILGKVPGKVKDLNLKVFNLKSRVNETRFLVQHESCECKYRLNGNLCNLKPKMGP